MRQKPIHPALQEYLDGKVILINKPLRWTSFDVVKKIRILTGVSKVGHAGTLDPLATGLLIICTGKFTKKLNEYMSQEKEYTGTITLGGTTPSFDLETTPGNFKDIAFLRRQQMIDAASALTGEIMQIPPIYSAIKQDGKPIYLAARKGVEVEVKPRRVIIPAFELTNFDLPFVDFRVTCSTGTYIRSLANDFGANLNVGAYLSSLCRTRIGNFTLAEAQSVEQFEQNVNGLKMDWKE